MYPFVMREQVYKNGFSLSPVYLPVPYSNIPYCLLCDIDQIQEVGTSMDQLVSYWMWTMG